ncbi:MAG TPA: sulfatase-like hydrolase/transferase [Burkholderiales bacterium]|nr:sulfatase-like hydrolase/transferase [Burkholderiales bacterium]
MSAGPRPTRPRRSLAIALVIAALAAYLVMNWTIVVDVATNATRPPAKTALYTAWIACGFVTFAAFTIAARAWLLWALLACAFVSLTVNYAYLSIMREALTVDVIEWLPHEIGQLGNVSIEHGAKILPATARAAALIAVFVVLRWLARRSGGVAERLATHRRASPLATLALLGFTAAGMVLQPPSSVAESNLYAFGIPALYARAPDPRPLDARPVRASPFRKIVVIVDESVTREAYERLVARRTQGLPVADFGEAASTTNCSAPSNALLRWGVRREEAAHADYDPRTNPMIWAYARAAGFATVLIDGQSTGGKQNYLNPKELELIEEFVPAERDAQTDIAIADILNKRLKSPRPAFIYVVKKGAHFPYEMNYPPDAVRANASRAEKYAAAVSHTTGKFFERLSRGLPFDRILLVYTSDHGQDLTKRATHCNGDPAAEEYSVPLLAITGDRKGAGFRSSETLFDHASHLNIFPTVLISLGYDEHWVAATYGPSLAGPPSPYLSFVNRGWQGQRGAERHTVRASDFVTSETFPKRAPGAGRQLMLED